MNRKKNRRGRVGVAVALAAGFLLGGATYGAVLVAGATGTSATYYACVSSIRGVPYNVQTKGAPRCDRKDKSISWNQTGPAGATGSQGPAGTQGIQGPPAVLPSGSISGAEPWVGSAQVPAGTTEYDVSCPNAGQVVLSGTAFEVVEGVGFEPLATIFAETNSFQSFMGVELTAPYPGSEVDYQMLCGNVSS